MIACHTVTDHCERPETDDFFNQPSSASVNFINKQIKMPPVQPSENRIMYSSFSELVEAVTARPLITRDVS